MTSTTPGRATLGPVRLGVLDEPELVATGLAGMLGPHSDRVELALLDDSTTSTDGLDVVLCDPLLRDRGARDHVEQVAGLGTARVLVYTWNTRAPGLSEVIEAGALGIVPKSSTTRELLAAVEAAHRGETVDGVPHETVEVFPLLSQRESDVLHLICRGLSNLEIATELYVSVNSVKTYIRQIYAKTGVARRTQAVAWAHRQGYSP
ncbi:response regulator transcription factor [Nocardioides sp. W7]|uniref:helix-turn-helix transcriptional regulator n=1 Tax=Nocardioides sp. W7 TaxID=2931390 RepID=UPI001FD2BB9B|nr:response regulator transcription factor [Nocardioides sp. W7]